jgi:hypothetical protein
MATTGRLGDTLAVLLDRLDDAAAGYADPLLDNHVAALREEVDAFDAADLHLQLQPGELRPAYLQAMSLLDHLPS